MSIACSTGSRAVGERDVVDVQVAVDPRQRRSRPGASRISGSTSRTVLIFSIAAPADCTWPYRSESSCSGWKTRFSTNTDETSVPIVSEPWPSRCPPTQSTETVAIAPRNSIPGKNSELSHCACVFVCAVRLVRAVELGRGTRARG